MAREISKAGSRTSSWQSFPSPLLPSPRGWGKLQQRKLIEFWLDVTPAPSSAGWIIKGVAKSLWEGEEERLLLGQAWLLRIISIRSWKKNFEGRGRSLEGMEGRGGSNQRGWKGVWHDYALAILNRARTREVGRIKIMNPLGRNG